MAEQGVKHKKPSLAESLAELRAFLGCPTPASWLEAAAAPEALPILLIDHANCERKAATTALALVARYVNQPQLLLPLSRLAREELHHFEQVVALMEARGIAYKPVSASRYAARLHQGVATSEPQRLVDLLIVAAFIEARSCERFAVLAPLLADAELSRFYRQLLRSEARHYRTYLEFAREISLDFAREASISCGQEMCGQTLDERIAYFRQLEADAVLAVDSLLRFHSGQPPAMSLS